MPKPPPLLVVLIKSTPSEKRFLFEHIMIIFGRVSGCTNTLDSSSLIFSTCSNGPLYFFFRIENQNRVLTIQVFKILKTTCKLVVSKYCIHGENTCNRIRFFFQISLDFLNCRECFSKLCEKNTDQQFIDFVNCSCKTLQNFRYKCCCWFVRTVACSMEFHTKL